MWLLCESTLYWKESPSSWNLIAMESEWYCLGGQIMRYRPNAYFIWANYDNDFRWRLLVQASPDSPVVSVAWSFKKRKTLAKLKGDIAEFLHKYQIEFSCNCYILNYQTWVAKDFDNRFETIKGDLGNV